MRCGHLFNGIGGFALAASWMGWNNIMHCEIDPFCNQVMNHHFPNSYQHEDIRTTDFTIWRGKIELITGGFPCQPYSAAGKRKGKDDDRHLWPQMLRAIREIQPGWIVGENVRGLTNWNGGLVFDEVQSDLETEGYEVLPFLLPACALNASHRRDRVWFIAHHNVFRHNSSNGAEENKIFRKQPEDNEQARNRWAGKNIGFVHEWTTAQPKWFTERKFDKNYGFTTEPGICRGDDGFPNRVDRIKALGNAIVPQAVYQIFKAIEQYESPPR